MISGAYGAALGATVGWALAVGLGASTIAAVITLSPVVRVTATALHVGKAVLPRSAIAGCIPLDSAEAKLARGTGADARSYVALKSLHSSTAVLIELIDPTDPHPSWLVTTAHPEALVNALSSTSDEASPASAESSSTNARLRQENHE